MAVVWKKIYFVCKIRLKVSLCQLCQHFTSIFFTRKPNERVFFINSFYLNVLWCKKIDRKGAHKMLVKLITTCFVLSLISSFQIQSRWELSPSPCLRSDDFWLVTLWNMLTFFFLTFNETKVCIFTALENEASAILWMRQYYFYPLYYSTSETLSRNTPPIKFQSKE
jgi:hypothetical protein